MLAGQRRLVLCCIFAAAAAAAVGGSPSCIVTVLPAGRELGPADAVISPHAADSYHLALG